MAITNATFTPANTTMANAFNGTVPVEQGQAIIQDIMSNSLMMQMAKYEEMSTQEKTFDVFLNGVGAYWVGEGQRIQTTAATWDKVTMKAHKLGVIIPVSREYLGYKQADFFEFMKPYLAEAFYKKFDAATLLNVDNPYTQSIEESVITAANKVSGDLTVVNIDAAIMKLNDEGYEPNAIVSKLQNNSIIKPLVRSENGLITRIYNDGAIDGVPVLNLSKDLTDFKKGSIFLGDFDHAYYGIPYNMNYAISTDATLTTVVGDDGAALNLFEREMVALRVTMDIAFMIIKDDAFAKVEAVVIP